MKSRSSAPSKDSIGNASLPPPSVKDTNACVSPRVNNAEPCARGRTPSSISIGRTVLLSRPSIRGLPAKIFPRIIRAVRFSITSSAQDSSVDCARSVSGNNSAMRAFAAV